MSLETDFRDLLLADPDLFGRVASRVYPDIAPQKAPRPHVVFNRTSARRPQAGDGFRDLIQPRIVYIVSADSRAEARSVVDRIVAVLEAFRGLAGSTQVRRTEIDEEIDDVQLPTGGAETAVYQTRLDVLVWTTD